MRWPSWFRVLLQALLLVVCAGVLDAGSSRSGRNGRNMPFVPASPCPQLFSYMQDGQTGQILGALRIPPPMVSTKIDLAVHFVVPVYLNTINQYAGTVELIEDKNAVIRRLRQGNLQPISYRVHFPIQRPLPILARIVVNDETICSQQSGNIGTSFTSLSMAHTLMSPVPIILTSLASPSANSPNANKPINTNPGQNNQQNNGFPQNPPAFLETDQVFIIHEDQNIQRVTTTKPNEFSFLSPPSPAPDVDIGENRPKVTTARVPVVENSSPFGGEQTPEPVSERFPQQECGEAVHSNQLLVNGENVKRGSWPWLAAVFLTTSTGLEFQCGGTLVSQRHVITAAHCVVNGNSAQKVAKPEGILIYLGKHNLLSWTERDAQPKDVSRIVVHPLYGEGSEHTGNDLAIISLTSPASFSLYVRPACLWDSRIIFSDQGSVVGWGKDEKGNTVSEAPKRVVLPIVSQEECLRSNKDFFYLTSNTTFCAGSRNGSGPCNGDSGGGMYLKSEATGKWFLRGVVSVSLQDQKTLSCDLLNYVVFTDLSKFGRWIGQNMSR